MNRKFLSQMLPLILLGSFLLAQGKFDTDYWASCSKQASEWLVQYYRDYTSSSTPSVEGLPEQALITPFLSTAFHEDDVRPGFYIGSTRDNFTQSFPTYKVIHVIAVEGVPFCVVKANPTLQV